MTITNQFHSETLRDRILKQAAIHRRCILLLQAARADR